MESRTHTTNMTHKLLAININHATNTEYIQFAGYITNIENITNTVYTTGIRR